MSKRVIRHFLPFALPAKDREMAFMEEMEMAAVFCLAESERGKGGGVIFRKSPEELTFIAEAYYPLWLICWGKRNLLFDGFGIMGHTLSYDVLPDVQVFINEAQGSSETREAYSAFLSNYVDYFQDFADKEEKTIEGLITAPAFIKDFVSYLPEAKTIEEPIVNKITLSPTIDEDEISSSLQELSSLRAALKEDINRLRQAMKLISISTKNHVKTLRREIGTIQKEFDKKIEAARPSVIKETRIIQRKYDREITTLTRKFEQQLQDLHREHVKAEKTVERLTAEIGHFEDERDSCKLRKDETGELHWKQKIDEHKKALSALEKDIKDLDKKIEEVNAAKALEISKLRVDYAAKIEEAKEKIRELEASREAEVRMRQEEIKKLEDMSSTIVNQIDKLLELKKASLKEFEDMGIPRRRREYVQVYPPFYIACYQRGTEKRYVVHPPSFAGGMGVLTKFKGVFGAAKIKSLLQHRSKAITNLLNQLIILIKQNPVFEKEIGDASTKANILRTKESRKRIKRGLEELKDEGWISESELQAFGGTL